MKPEDYVKIYNAVPIFRSLSREEIDEVVGASRLFRAPAGYTILKEGLPGQGMYVIVSGMANCRLKLHQGDETPLATLHKGDVFGEMSLIDDGPVSATITTVDECVLYHIDKARFAEMRTAMRPAAYKILRALAPTICERLRAINARIGEVFAEPEKSLAIMEQRYKQLAQHSRIVDAPQTDVRRREQR